MEKNEYTLYCEKKEKELNKYGFSIAQATSPSLHWHIQAAEGNESILVGNYYNTSKADAICKFIKNILGKDTEEF